MIISLIFNYMKRLKLYLIYYSKQILIKAFIYRLLIKSSFNDKVIIKRIKIVNKYLKKIKTITKIIKINIKMLILKFKDNTDLLSY